MNLPIYYSHGYREREASFNQYFGLLIKQFGFIPSLDPPSGDVNSAKLEKHLKHTVGLIAIVTNRDGGISPYIRYEIDIAIRARKPVLAFIEDSLPDNILPNFILRKRFSSKSFVREYFEHLHALEIFKTYIGSKTIPKYQHLTQQKSALLIGFESSKKDLLIGTKEMISSLGYKIIDFEVDNSENTLLYGLDHFRISDSYVAICLLDNISPKESYKLGIVRSIQIPTILTAFNPNSPLNNWIPSEFQRRILPENTTESISKISSQIELFEEDFVELDKEGKVEQYINSLSRGFSEKGEYTDELRTQIINNITMGDKFENISNSTIINKSVVDNAFNKVKSVADEETANAIKMIAEKVNESGNVAAVSLFNNFSEEIEKEKPEKSKLEQYWNGLISVLPSITSLVGVAEKVIGLF
ncbi:hypothetical protein [Maribellus mangrovi]|uniref:hypothetical protein n=1 Tax=Maribellus mangrovi TaxID=3133146 RepID=UPI0030EBCB51